MQVPYSAITDLPPAVGDQLSREEQRQWMAVFNDVVARKGEAAAFAAAWAAVDNGEYVEVPEKYADIDLVPPEGAQNNARKALDWRDEHPDEIEGGTRVGWTRANQLADGQELSPDIIKRMAAFERHRENAKINEEHEGTPWKDAGYVAWLLWGGDAGVEWAQRKSDELDRADEDAQDNAELADVLQLAETEKIWVPAFKVGETTHHKMRSFTVDPDFIESLKRGFKALTSDGYYPPVLQQHDSDGMGKEPRPVEDGYIHGKHIGIRVKDGRVEYQLEVVKDLYSAWEEGRVENWSPSLYFDWEHPHTGETLDVAPRHHAFVSVPHQKNLGKSSPGYEYREQISLMEAAMADQEEGKNTEDLGEDMDYMSREEMAEYMDDMGSTLAKIEEMLSLLTEGMGGGEENADDEDPEMQEVKAELSEVRDQLQAERQKRYEQRVKSVNPDIEDDELKEVVELAETDADEYAARLLEMAEANQPAQGARRQSEIGSQGTAPQAPKGADAKYQELRTKYQNEGMDRQKAIGKAFSEAYN